MALDKKKLLRTRAKSMLQTLETETGNATRNRVSTTLAESYNTLLDDIVEVVPELQGALPNQIRSTTPFAKMGESDADHVDLKVFLNQAVDLLDAVCEQDRAG
ncbi:hypothetical protein LCGC14_2806660 [marine sediment metagenome]|uniref:Uncharacterized protein n=1 Tax=marine sediment metagenome TaxID=412755 RepID=A0A0F8Z7W7_9ZZZZ